jgi:hypothetical protein
VIAGSSYGFMQVESLQEQTSELHKKIDDQRDLSSHRALQQQDTMARLADTLAEKRSSADFVEKKLQQCNTILEKQLQGINHIFHIVRCDAAPILSLLGEYKQHIVILPLGMFSISYAYVCVNVTYVCANHQILLGLSNQGGQDGQVMQYIWEGREICM